MSNSPGEYSNKRVHVNRGVPTISSVGSPIEDEASARQKLKQWNFDPDGDLTKESNRWFESDQYKPWRGLGRVPLRPMLLFASLEDIPMMRYILLKTGDATEVFRPDASGMYFPMLMICFNFGHDWAYGKIKTCRWLKEQGASFSQRNAKGQSVLREAYRMDSLCMVLWLLKEGALLNHLGEFDDYAAENDLGVGSERYSWMQRDYPRTTAGMLLTLTKDTVLIRRAFFVFLAGTLPFPELCTCRSRLETKLEQKLGSASDAKMIVDKMDTNECVHLLKLLSSPLHVFSGHPGIMELVADFVGVERGVILRTAQGLFQAYEKFNPSFDYVSKNYRPESWRQTITGEIVLSPTLACRTVGSRNGCGMDF